MVENDVAGKLSISRWVPVDALNDIKSSLLSMQESLNKERSASSFTLTGKEKSFPPPKDTIYSNSDITLTIAKKKGVFTFNPIIAGDSEFIASISKRDDSILVAAPYDNISLKSNFVFSDKKCDFCQESNHSQLFVRSFGDMAKFTCNTCAVKACGEKEMAFVNANFDILNYLMNEEFWLEIDKKIANKKYKSKWFDLASFLSMAIYLTNKQGFLRSDIPNSTREQILYAIANHDSSSVDPELSSIINSGPRSDAVKMIEFYKSISSTSNYVKGIQGLVSRSLLPLDDSFATGIMASAPSSYYEAINKNKIKNEPFGKVKERGPLKVRITDISYIDDKEFPITKYRMMDDFGRKFVWKASGNGLDELQIGKFYTIDATIKSHSEFKSIHYTMLSRCGNAVEVDLKHPIPDFYKESIKRSFKETSSFSFEFKNSKGLIDGHSYLIVKRSWRENKIVRVFEGEMRLPFSPSSLSELIKTMSLRTGVDRIDKSGHVNVKHKSDKKFIGILEEELKTYVCDCVLEDKTVYMVDDVNPPLWASEPLMWESPSSPKSEAVLRKQSFYLNVDDALKHGEKMQAGRLTKIKVNRANFVLVPRLFKLSSIDEQNEFKEKAKSSGYNIICLMDELGHLKSIEPLGWLLSQNKKDFTTLGVLPTHRELPKEYLDHNQRVLASANLILVTGALNHESLMLKIKDKIGLSNEDKGNGFASFRFLTKDDNLEIRGDKRFLAFIDDATCFYMKKFNANAIYLHFVVDGEEYTGNALPVFVEPGDDETVLVEKIREALRLSSPDLINNVFRANKEK